jgi:hypothetical protein
MLRSSRGAQKLNNETIGIVTVEMNSEFHRFFGVPAMKRKEGFPHLSSGTGCSNGFDSGVQ